MANESYAMYRVYLIASCAAIFALFPLLIRPDGKRYPNRNVASLTVMAETIYKLVYASLWALLSLAELGRTVHRCVLLTSQQ